MESFQLARYTLIAESESFALRCLLGIPHWHLSMLPMNSARQLRLFFEMRESGLQEIDNQVVLL